MFRESAREETETSIFFSYIFQPKKKI